MLLLWALTSTKQRIRLLLLLCILAHLASALLRCALMRSVIVMSLSGGLRVRGRNTQYRRVCEALTRHTLCHCLLSCRRCWRTRLRIVRVCTCWYAQAMNTRAWCDGWLRLVVDDVRFRVNNWIVCSREKSDRASILLHLTNEIRCALTHAHCLTPLRVQRLFRFSIGSSSKSTELRNLSAPHNFVRFYLPTVRHAFAL
jgi:hypothetical protein